MRLFELLLERRYQHTVEMYHGTSSDNLRSILKNGLLPDTGKIGWAPNEYFKSYGGVYLTTRYKTALRAAQMVTNNWRKAPDPDKFPVMITVEYVLGSSGIDEDALTQVISHVMTKPNLSSIEKSNEVIRYIETALQNAKPNLRNLKTLLPPLFDYVNDLLANNGPKIPGNSKILGDPKFRSQVAKILDSIKLYRSIGSSYFPDEEDEDDEDEDDDYLGVKEVRVTRPIKYKGKTRITKIENADTGKVYYSS